MFSVLARIFKKEELHREMPMPDTLPRGIRNNNPGNIRHGDNWLGLVKGDDPSFCTFETHIYGIRAIMVILKNYYKRHKLDTVEKIIGRWAPPNENDTISYAKAVAAGLGVAVDEPINVMKAGIMKSLAQEIVKHENGPAKEKPWAMPYWYPVSDYVRAYKMVISRLN